MEERSKGLKGKGKKNVEREKSERKGTEAVSGSPGAVAVVPARLPDRARTGPVRR